MATRFTEHQRCILLGYPITEEQLKTYPGKITRSMLNVNFDGDWYSVHSYNKRTGNLRLANEWGLFSANRKGTEVFRMEEEYVGNIPGFVFPTFDDEDEEKGGEGEWKGQQVL